MAKFYEFTIAQGEAGNSLPAQNFVVTADRGFSRQVSFDILTAKFGDGYEQRALNGINSKQETFSVTFNNRNYTEGNLIAAFFDQKKAKNFQLKITNTKDAEAANPTDTFETLTVVCDGYTLTYPNENVINLKASFRRVYEPVA